MLRVYVDVPTARSDALQPKAGVRQVNSQQLLGSTRELLIEHNGQWYRLRETRARKLILTK
jgi:hemin uptake protein HemP